MNDLIDKNKEIKVKFTSFTHDGKGVCKVNGYNYKGEYLTNFPIFVENALPKEEGIIKLTLVKKTLGCGTIKKIFKDTISKDRVKPMCDIYETCGGCHLQHMSYDAQLKFKKQIVIDTLSKIGNINTLVNDVIPSLNKLKYRNKVQIPFGFCNNKTTCGFYQKESHNIIPINTCYLQRDEITDIVKLIRNLCNEYRIKGYDETTKKGELRHVLIKESTTTNQIMVVLVTVKKDITNLSNLVNKLITKFNKITSVILNINNKDTNVILGDKNILLYGNDYIEDILLGNKYQLGVNSFYQVNKETTEILYQKAIEVGNFSKTNNIIDAYCGIGTIGISISKYVNKVYGVEVIEEAIKNAKMALKLNKINNVELICNDATKQIEAWCNDGIQIDGIIVDPPRKGLEIKLMDTINKMNINKIVYISCNVATLARDLKYLETLNYKINSVTPVDMFPQTLHVECVVSLSRNR